jgi:hypothetical protein
MYFNRYILFSMILSLPLCSCGKEGGSPTTIATQSANHSPTAIADELTTFAGLPFSILVLGNDSDPNGDTLSILSFTPPAHGTVTIASDTLRYTPKSSSYVGLDTFSYTISDGRGGTATASVTAAMQASQSDSPIANRSPVANTDSATLLAGAGAYVIIDVLANDTDANGDTLTILGFTQSGAGKLELVDGKFRYTPNAGYAGLDGFNYWISDGRGGLAFGGVYLGVQGVRN